MNITFETKVYEKDWEYILTANYLKEMIARCDCSFDDKVVFINNVKDIDKVKKACEDKIEKGIITKYYIVEEYADDALNFFDIQKESFKSGYYYSIAELVSIYLCKTEYLLHFSGDSYLPKNNSEWISEALNILKNDEKIVVANPTWNFNFKEAAKESTTKRDGFYISQGFSDQCYLIKISDFRKKIYHYAHAESERYPSYGGELFEKRVDSYLRNENLYRITSSTNSYIHKNFSKNKTKKLLYLTLQKLFKHKGILEFLR